MQPQAPPPPRPRRRRRRWPWVLLLLPVVALAIVLRTNLVERIVVESVEAAAGVYLGESLHIDDIELSYVPLQVRVRGITLLHPGALEPFVKVRGVHATIGFVGWRPGLERLTVDQPEVDLHLRADGLLEFRNLDLPKSAGGTPAAPAEHFPFHELNVVAGHFAVHGDDLEVVLDGFGLRVVDEVATVRIGSLRVDAGPLHQEVEPVTWSDVALSPRGVTVPALVLRTKDVAIDGRIGVPFGAGEPLDGALSAHLGLAGLTAGSDPRRFVDGSVDVDVTLGGPLADPTVDGGLLTHAIAIVQPLGDTEARRIAFGDVAGPFHYAQKRVHAGRLEMNWDGARLGIEADVDLTTRTLSAGVLAEDLSLARILTSTGAFQNPWVDFHGDLEAHVSGTLSPFLLQGPFEIALVDLAVTQDGYASGNPPILDVRDARLNGALTLDATHIVIDSPRTAIGALTRGHARADIGFAHDGPLRVDADLEPLDLAQLAPLGDAGLAGLAHVRGTLSGPFDHLSAELVADGRDLEVLELPWADRFHTRITSPDLQRLQFTGIEAERGQTAYQGNLELAFLPEGMHLDAQIYVAQGYIRDLTGIFLDLPGLDGRVSGTVALSGPVYHLDGDANLELAEVDLWGEPFATGHVTGWMDDGLFTLEELRLRREDESLLARGTVGPTGWVTRLEVLSDGFAVQRLAHLDGLGQPLRGRLNLDAQVGGTLFDLAPRGRLTLRETAYADRAVRDSTVRFRTEPAGTLAWEASLLGGSLRSSGTLGMHDEQRYALHADFRDLPLDLLYPTGADGSPITATLTGQLDLSGRFGEHPTPVAIDGRLDQVLAAWNGHELRNPAPWTFTVTGTDVRISPLDLGDGRATLLEVEEGYTSGDGSIALRGGGTLDLDLVRALAPGVTEARGTATVEFALERGPGQDLRVGVDARVRRGAFLTEYFPEAFTDVDATIHAGADGYAITDVKATVGGGRLVGGGRIDAEGWRPRRYDLFADVKDARVKYIDALPPMRGNASLHFDGPVGDLQLGGTIDLTDLTWRDRIPWEEWVVRSERLSSSASAERDNLFAFDLQIHAPGTLHLRNNVADADGSAELRIGGTTARPELSGTVSLAPGGQIYYGGRALELTRAEMRYVDPVSFDPDLDFVLQTDVRGLDQDYHLGVTVDGTMSAFRINASGEGLSSDDALFVLQTGMTTAEAQSSGGAAGLSPVLSQTGELISKGFGEGGIPLVDRWNLVSGVDERGSTLFSDDYRLVAQKEIAGFTVTGEATIIGNPNFYLAVERRFAKRLVASLYYATVQQGRYLPVGGAYGTELKYRWELD